MDNVELTRDHNITTGKVYKTVIEKERRGEYLGRAVQIIPHITNEIKDRIRRVARRAADVCVIEVGGTVGDIEGMPFLEAMRQLQGEEMGNIAFVRITTSSDDDRRRAEDEAGQHSVKEMRALGLSPTSSPVRCTTPLRRTRRSRRSPLFCGVHGGGVVSNHDVDDVYKVPSSWRSRERRCT